MYKFHGTKKEILRKALDNTELGKIEFKEDKLSETESTRFESDEKAVKLKAYIKDKPHLNGDIIWGRESRTLYHISASRVEFGNAYGEAVGVINSMIVPSYVRKLKECDKKNENGSATKQNKLEKEFLTHKMQADRGFYFIAYILGVLKRKFEAGEFHWLPKPVFRNE